MSERIYFLRAASAAQAARWSRPLPSPAELRRARHQFESALWWWRQLRWSGPGWRRAVVWRLCCVFAPQQPWEQVRRWCWAERQRLWGV